MAAQDPAAGNLATHGGPARRGYPVDGIQRRNPGDIMSGSLRPHVDPMEISPGQGGCARFGAGKSIIGHTCVENERHRATDIGALMTTDAIGIEQAFIHQAAVNLAPATHPEGHWAAALAVMHGMAIHTRAAYLGRRSDRTSRQHDEKYPPRCQVPHHLGPIV